MWAAPIGSADSVLLFVLVGLVLVALGCLAAAWRV
jgi:hypothetical protein